MTEPSWPRAPSRSSIRRWRASRAASLEHHVARGDFCRWARDVLGDADLAAGLAKLETTSATGAPVDREELRRHLHVRYVL